MVLYCDSVWQALGCYKDGGTRALSQIYSYPMTDEQKKNNKALFETCSAGADKQGITLFGIQHKKECWGAKPGEEYDKYGCADNCEKTGKYGTGTDWSNFVWRKAVLTPNIDGSTESEWTACDAKCGDGVQYKMILEDVKDPSCPAYNKKVVKTKETQPCSVPNPCPVDGEWTPYSAWSACTKSCGRGTQKRTRTCTKPPPAHGGEPCSGSTEETQECSANACPGLSWTF